MRCGLLYRQDQGTSYRLCIPARGDLRTQVLSWCCAKPFVKGMGSCHIVGSAYHKDTTAKVKWANSIIGNTLRAFANDRKDDWDRQLPLAVFAIKNTAFTLALTLFIDWGIRFGPWT